MLRTVDDAMDFLHRGRGDAVPERTIARNTKVLRVTDDLAALRLHDTIIAWYGPNGTLIDTQNWHTRVTWRRISDFTPANVVSAPGFLRYVVQPNGDRTLYRPGTKVDADGIVLNPLWPSEQRNIERIVAETMKRCRIYAREAAQEWDRFGTYGCADCNQYVVSATGLASKEAGAHLISHMDGGHAYLPNCFVSDAERNMAMGDHGDKLVRKIERSFTNVLVRTVLPAAVKANHPNFPIPTYTHPQQLPY
jgi:hypothetical protein